MSAGPVITSESQVAKNAEILPPAGEDFDIFQGVEEYDGLASEDDGEPDRVHSGSGVQAASGSNKWFLDEPTERRAPFQARPPTPDQKPSVQAKVINEEEEEFDTTGAGRSCLPGDKDRAALSTLPDTDE